MAELYTVNKIGCISQEIKPNVSLFQQSVHTPWAKKYETKLLKGFILIQRQVLSLHSSKQ